MFLSIEPFIVSEGDIVVDQHPFVADDALFSVSAEVGEEIKGRIYVETKNVKDPNKFTVDFMGYIFKGKFEN